MSYVKIWIHAVWGTKRRRPFYNRQSWRNFVGISAKMPKAKEIHVDRINGHHDHIHVLMLLKSEYGISKQMQLLKGESAFWLTK